MAKKNGKKNGSGAYELADDIEIPLTPRRSKFPWEDMKVGQSFAIVGTGSGAYTSARKYGYKVKVRQDPKNADSKRVWRVE